jgi:hypothetical protein
MVVPVALEYPQRLVHLGLGQVLPDPVGIPLASFGPTGRITNDFALSKLDDFARHFTPADDPLIA